MKNKFGRGSLQACKSGTPMRLTRSISSRFKARTSKKKQMLLGTREINKMDDETDRPKLSSLSTHRKEVENDCSLENQTTMAENRIRNKGKNKLTVQMEPTASSKLKMSSSTIKDSTQKEDSSSFHLMSGASRILEQPKEREPFSANYVKHVALASPTSPTVNAEVAEAESLPSAKASESMSESFQERPKRPGTSNESFPSSQSDINKPLKKRRAYYGQACSDSFGKETQSTFAPITPQDELLLKSGDVFRHSCSNGAEKRSLDEKSTSFSEGLGIAKSSIVVPSLYRRVISLINEDGDDIDNPNLSFHPMDMPSSSLSGVTDWDFDAEEIVASEIQSEANLQSRDDRMLQELHNIGVYPEIESRTEDKEDWVDREFKKLAEELLLKGDGRRKNSEDPKPVQNNGLTIDSISGATYRKIASERSGPNLHSGFSGSRQGPNLPSRFSGSRQGLAHSRQSGGLNEGAKTKKG